MVLYNTPESFTPWWSITPFKISLNQPHYKYIGFTFILERNAQALILNQKGCVCLNVAAYEPYKLCLMQRNCIAITFTHGSQMLVHSRSVFIQLVFTLKQSVVVFFDVACFSSHYLTCCNINIRVICIPSIWIVITTFKVLFYLCCRQLQLACGIDATNRGAGGGTLTAQHCGFFTMKLLKSKLSRKLRV